MHNFNIKVFLPLIEHYFYNDCSLKNTVHRYLWFLKKKHYKFILANLSVKYLYEKLQESIFNKFFEV